jgi:hypothetical protein
MDERPDHADLARLAFLEELHARDIVRRNPPVRADLDDPVGCARGLDHRPPLVDRVADGLLDVDVRTRFDRRDRDQGVPVVGRGDDDDLGPLALQQLAIILVPPRLIAGELADLGQGRLELVVVDVAQRNRLALVRAERLAVDVHAPPAAADQRRAVALVGLGGRDHGRRRQQCTGGGRGPDELATIHGYVHDSLSRSVSGTNLRMPTPRPPASSPGPCERRSGRPVSSIRG